MIIHVGKYAKAPKHYSRGINQCAICVGLKHDDEMLMGVVSVLCTALPVYHKEYTEVCSRIIVNSCLASCRTDNYTKRDFSYQQY